MILLLDFSIPPFSIICNLHTSVHTCVFIIHSFDIYELIDQCLICLQFSVSVPPCLGAQRRIPTEERNGRSQVLVGE